MQVSSTSAASIEWSENAKILITKLVALDEQQRNDKNVIYEELYELWKRDGLGTTTLLKDSFEKNKSFIKERILMSLNPPKRIEIDNAKLILQTLKSGKEFITSEGAVIPDTTEDIEYWISKTKVHHRLINRRYNNLLNEFAEYLTYRKEEKPEVLFFSAQKKIMATRENPSRVAKVKVLEGDYKGMTSNKPVGRRRIVKRVISDEVIIITII